MFAKALSSSTANALKKLNSSSFFDKTAAYLAGGTALLPGLREYCQEQFKKDTEVCNPFSSIFYPPILERKLERMGPAFAIAVGAALRGLEY